MREQIDYSKRREFKASEQYGTPINQPQEGYYRMRLISGGVLCGIKVWWGPPNDPVTGEPLDRSWRWQAMANGAEIEFDRVWPACAKDPISEQEYRGYVAQARWAKENAPQSAYANPRKRHDPLSTSAPLPFGG